MGISTSYFEEVDIRFHEFLRQHGSALLMGTTIEPVVGDAKYLRQVDVGAAHFVSGSGAPTSYVPITYDRRRLKPRAFDCPIMLDKFDVARQAYPDPGQLAAQAADSCGVLIDQIILDGIGGLAYTENTGAIALPNSQVIAYDDVTLADYQNMQSSNATLRYGLSTSKVAKAVQMLRTHFNTGPIICVANNYALSTLRADPRAASSQFNTVQSLSMGIDAPYGGVNAFAACEQMGGGMSINTKTAVHVTYAYVYAMDQIKLGISMELMLDAGKSASHGLNDIFIYSGMYDCLRMQEKAVVRIEINTIGGVVPTSYTPTPVNVKKESK